MVISMLKIRRPLGRLIFNMGIAIPGKTVFLIETAPRLLHWHWGNHLILPVNQPWRIRVKSTSTNYSRLQVLTMCFVQYAKLSYICILLTGHVYFYYNPLILCMCMYTTFVLAITVFEISAGLRTLTAKTCVGPANFPSLPCINF